MILFDVELVKSLIVEANELILKRIRELEEQLKTEKRMRETNQRDVWKYFEDLEEMYNVRQNEKE